MSKWAFINEDFILEASVSLHFSDLAIQRGYGIFDFFKIENNSPLFLDEHLRRFFHSAEQMHLSPGKTKEELKSIIYQLMEKNALPNSGLRITLTGGYSADGYGLAKPNLILSQSLFKLPSEEQFQKGIKLVTHEHQRQLPHVKSIDYLMAIWLQPFIKQNNADDVLYYSGNSVTECPRANFFIVTKDDTIVTPQQNILKGITRNNLIEIASTNFKIEERDTSLQEVLQAKEAFITSTTKNILPVHSINGTRITAGAGLITKELFQLLQAKLVAQVSESLKQ
jgi:branched-chain amino acid aminotransferase